MRELGLRKVLTWCLGPDTDARELFEHSGFREARRFYRMIVEHDGEPPAPKWPEGFRVGTFEPGDARAFHSALDGALAQEWNFVSTPFEQWVANRIEAPEFDPTLWFIVREEDEIAAVLRGQPVEWRGAGWVGASACAPGGGNVGSASRYCTTPSESSIAAASHASGSASTQRIRPVRLGSTSVRACMSPTRRLRSRKSFREPSARKCPDCKTFTSVAIELEYECHSCGRVYLAGMVRVPQAWGDGGESMAEAAWLELPYPETAIIEADTLEEQNLALAADLPERPLILGGCCCSHIGAVEGLAARQDRLSVIWFDAHGDLNTAETSPSGNLWGMPLRKLIDSGAVDAGDVALVGARNLDPPEEVFIREHGVQVGEEGIARALAGASCTYVAFDADVLEPSEMSVFMPEPGGLSVADAERMLPGARQPDGGRRRGVHGCRLRAGQRHPAGPAGLCRRPVTAWRQRQSKIVSSMSSRIDVSIEHRNVPEPPGKQHPNTCPQCASHYRDDELEAALWVCPHCGHHFTMRARTRIALWPTRARSSRRPPIFARRIRSTSSTSARIPSDLPRRR